MMLPAYGRKLAAARKRGLVPARDVLVFLDYWPPRRDIFFSLVIPQQADPGDIDFSVLIGLWVILVARPGVAAFRVLRAVNAILAAEPQALHVTDGNGWQIVKRGANG
jgi:hypothetical protein